MKYTISKILKGALAIIAICVLGKIMYGYYKENIYDVYMKEYKGTESFKGEDVIVEIPKGCSAKKVAEILYDAGLIKYKRAFLSRLKESEYRGKLQSGTYTLNTGMNTLEMIEIMCPVYEGKEVVKRVTIPEGFSIEQIAKRVEKEEICSEEEFLKAINSVTTTQFPYLADVPSNPNIKYRLQGYIYPATYDIYADTTAESLVADMLTAFENYYTKDLQNRAQELGYTSYDVVTRASIVEREVRVGEERPIVAGVINNRLKQGMKLQMCPTVLYPMTDGLYDVGRVLYEDLEIDSPYNTYMHEGLPVGPICNPGLACINAVLYPEETSYLYYHVGNSETGEHIFSETYQEHVDTQIIGGPNGISKEDADKLDNGEDVDLSEYKDESGAQN